MPFLNAPKSSIFTFLLGFVIGIMQVRTTPQCKCPNELIFENAHTPQDHAC